MLEIEPPVIGLYQKLESTACVSSFTQAIVSHSTEEYC